MAEGGDSPVRDSNSSEPCMLKDGLHLVGFGRARPLGVYSFGRGRPMGSVGPDDLVGGPVATSTPLKDAVCGPRTSRAPPVTCSAPMSTPAAHTVPTFTQPMGPAPLPNTQAISVDTLGIVMSDLAKQISDNITASIHTLHQASVQTHTSQSSPPLAAADAAKVSVTVQSDAKLPPFFRGDHTDKFSVDEWEDLVTNHLRHVDRTEQEKFDLVMSRLLGKARDVVRVSLRCSAGLASRGTRSAVFDILKRNFSELTYSSMPMRDFYNTVPCYGESAMEYWIRLNKAIDVVEECLQRQQRVLKDPGTEVVAMFVSHCPDSSLAASLSFKPAEKWTPSEIQERLDIRQRELKRIGGMVRPPLLPVSMDCVRPITQSTVQNCESLPPHMTPQTLQSCAPVMPESAQPYSSTATEPSLSHVVSMLDKVLSVCTASMSPRSVPVQRSQAPHSETREPCRVCGTLQHSTFSHCRMDRLCHHCLRPGHIKSGCPTARQPRIGGAGHVSPTQLN